MVWTLKHRSRTLMLSCTFMFSSTLTSLAPTSERSLNNINTSTLWSFFTSSIQAEHCKKWISCKSKFYAIVKPRECCVLSQTRLLIQLGLEVGSCLIGQLPISCPCADSSPSASAVFPCSLLYNLPAVAISVEQDTILQNRIILFNHLVSKSC